MNPTILIPGIKGTKLVNTNTLDFDTIWSGVQSKYETIYDLMLGPNAKFDQSPSSIIERSDVEDLAYKEAVGIIKKKLKCQIYIFAYDWRRSCTENGKMLKEYVEYLKDKLRVRKFNFLTHSMGGLVFACFLKSLKSDYACIDRAILTVCPFKGSINALVALIKGEGGIKFPFLNSNDEFRKVARTFPSVYEICPTYKNAVYFELGHPFSGTKFNVVNPQHWQLNLLENPIFTKRLNSLKNFLINRPAMIDFARLKKSFRDRMLIVVGTGEETKNVVVIRQLNPTGEVKNYFDFDQPDGDGDGTVPYDSATYYKNAIVTLSVKSKWYDKATHGFFLNDGRVQSIIRRFFTGSTKRREWWSDIGGEVKKVI